MTQEGLSQQEFSAQARPELEWLGFLGFFSFFL